MELEQSMAYDKEKSPTHKTLKYFYVVLFFVPSVTFMCIYPSEYHYIVFTLFYIKGLSSIWEYVDLKAHIILVSLFCFALQSSSVWSPSTQKHTCEQNHACAHRPKPICGKILMILIVQPFPTISPHPPSRALPLSLCADLIRLQRMQAEWKNGDKYTAEI